MQTRVRQLGRWVAMVGGLALGALALLGLPGAHGATEGPTTEGFFPFVIPWDDATPGTATDASGLNRMPAGGGGFILSRGGHFIEEQTGQRVRFFATNLSARAAFPAGEDAEKIAARLSKLGINLVRLHHLQNGWEKDGGTVWTRGKPFFEVDPRQVDRLDALIAALKRHGIYANLNLTTTREYLPEHGFPETVRQIPFKHHKKIDKVNRRMIQLQKDYARALLARVNPYTGVAYKDEPALAFVEINNENSLVGWPGESAGQGLDTLPEPFRGELVALWNAWLAGKYRTDADLTAAWSGGAADLGANLLAPDTRWVFENQGATDAASHEVGPPQPAPGAPGPIRIAIKSAIGTDWVVQGLLGSFSLEEEASYTLSFRARADRERAVGVKLHLDRPDWEDHGLNTKVPLTTAWQDFTYTFQARSVTPGHSRLAFMVGGAPATIEIDAVTLRPGRLPFRLPAGESLALRNVGLGTNAPTGRGLEDWTLFLLETEKAYAEEMRRFLTVELGVRANIIDSQIPWGGLTALERESSMEYADNHAYWQHPVFTGGDWDRVRWRIGREAHLNVLDGSQGVLRDLALHRVAGRPYTVSEYDHPAPNDFRSEMMPLIATFASLQDWDGFYTFTYGPTGSGEANDRIGDFFDMAMDMAKTPFFPSTALIFRRGLVEPLPAAETLRLPERPWNWARNAADAWRKTGGLPDALRTRVAIAASGGSQPARERTGAPSAAPATRVARGSRGAIYVVDAPAARVVAGFVGGQTVELSDVTLTFPDFGYRQEGFAALTLVDLEGQPLAKTRRALLTIVGRAENQDMGWNAERTTVGDRWGTGPEVVEGVPCSLSVATARALEVFALDARGRRRRAVPARWLAGKLSFAIDARYETVWYELVDPRLKTASPQ